MPIAIRPSERSCSVAYALASTVGSRVRRVRDEVAELDLRRLASRDREQSGSTPARATCESYVHAYSKPCCSASWMSSSKRVHGGSGRTVTPKLIMAGGMYARRRQRRERGERTDGDEPDAAVAGKRERQADERRAGDDDEATTTRSRTRRQRRARRDARAPRRRTPSRTASPREPDRAPPRRTSPPTGSGIASTIGADAAEHEARRDPARRVRPCGASCRPRSA